MTTAELYAKMDAEFKAVRTEMQDLRLGMRTEGETTQRHFDVVAEQFKEYTKVLADGMAR